jgi:hypothetical protein
MWLICKNSIAIRQQELAKAAAIGVKWQDIFPGCREIAA